MTIHLDQNLQMAENSKIAILLATYNGENFISEQLDSLFSQTIQNFKIYVRDDGSTDNTINILKKYIKKNPNKITLLNDKTLHRGARDSFLWLLENVESQYFMFCDQDDVWLPYKIEHTLKKMTETELKNPGKAVMIHTDLKIVDKDLNVINSSFWNWGKFNVDLNRHFNFAALGNVFTGCTMMINSAAKKYIFPINTNIKLHDEWIGLTIVKNGIVDNLKEQTMLYRQHGNNVCSAGNKKEFNLKHYISFNINNWYDNRKPILDSVGYGSKTKAIFFKFLYSFIRTFYHN